MQRLNYYPKFQTAFEKLSEVEALVKASSLDPTLRHLVKILVSQINGCAFCVDMHSKEAKLEGERELRLYHIPVWRESPLFSPKEKAALAWAEAVTRLSHGPVSQEQFNAAREHFSDKELTELNMSIAMINLWNRFAAPFNATPGSMDKMLGLEMAALV